MSIGLAILILGGIAIFTALCGCATCKWKKPWLACPFVFLAFGLSVVMIVIGAVFLALNGPIVAAFMSGTCMIPEVLDFTTRYSAVVDKNMCTETCPCAKGEGGATQALWTSLGDDYLKNFGRDSVTAPFIWGGNNDQSNGAQKTYSVWTDCWNDKLSSGTDDNTKMLNDFLSNGG